MKIEAFKTSRTVSFFLGCLTTLGVLLLVRGVGTPDAAMAQSPSAESAGLLERVKALEGRLEATKKTADEAHNEVLGAGNDKLLARLKEVLRYSKEPVIDKDTGKVLDTVHDLTFFLTTRINTHQVNANGLNMPIDQKKYNAGVNIQGYATFQDEKKSIVLPLDPTK